MKLLSKTASLVIIILFAAILMQSCSDDNIFNLNFDDAPAPFDTSQAVRNSTIAGNIKIFILEEGEGPFDVVSKDAILVEFTGRTESGQIFDSSFNNRSPSTSRVLANLTPNAIPGRNGPISPLVEGFRKGLLGMKEGEIRTIIVPPDMGYDDSRPGTNGFDLRDETLTYDVELIDLR